ncbi:Agamous 57 [Hibiscus syriacus]|uniref:Agamous 57 n=1 Tax=Hibiscus syriacus TaxID=106335 RepID=A0A6A3AYB4_HIBSY|nr:Agamous 57 [Hibiscus syriacus]
MASTSDVYYIEEYPIMDSQPVNKLPFFNGANYALNIVANVGRLRRQFNTIIKRLQTESKRGEVLIEAIRVSHRKLEHQKPINELNRSGLLEMKESMEELCENIRGRVSEIEASSSLLLLSNIAVKQA